MSGYSVINLILFIAITSWLTKIDLSHLAVVDWITLGLTMIWLTTVVWNMALQVKLEKTKAHSK